jgi:hypothetical protein
VPLVGGDLLSDQLEFALGRLLGLESLGPGGARQGVFGLKGDPGEAGSPGLALDRPVNLEATALGLNNPKRPRNLVRPRDLHVGGLLDRPDLLKLALAAGLDLVGDRPLDEVADRADDPLDLGLVELFGAADPLADDLALRVDLCARPHLCL